MFPLFWWVLASFKPYTAIFNKHADLSRLRRRRCDNYAVTLLGKSRVELALEQGGGIGASPAARQLLFDPQHPRQHRRWPCGSTVLAVLLATLAAYALSRCEFRGKQHLVFWVLSQRMMPPIAVAVPLFFMFRDLGPARHAISA